MQLARFSRCNPYFPDAEHGALNSILWRLDLGYLVHLGKLSFSYRPRSDFGQQRSDIHFRFRPLGHRLQLVRFSLGNPYFQEVGHGGLTVQHGSGHRVAGFRPVQIRHHGHWLHNSGVDRIDGQHWIGHRMGRFGRGQFSIVSRYTRGFGHDRINGRLRRHPREVRIDVDATIDRFNLSYVSKSGGSLDGSDGHLCTRHSVGVVRVEKFGIGLPGFRDANCDRFESNHLGGDLDNQFHLDQFTSGSGSTPELSNRGFGPGDHYRSYHIGWNLHHHV